MVEVFKVKLPLLAGEEERNAYIYLPESYQWDPGKRYPVLYMFDGHNVFFDSHATYGKCWGMKEYMEYSSTQMIIAAVECSHSPDNGRLSEYSPYDFSDPKYGQNTGKGKQYMDWLTGTFKELIDRKYRTLSDREHTFICGSSMGGLMSLYALMEYNQYFSRAAALSPSIWFEPERLREMIAGASIRPDTVLYMDYGSREILFHENMISQFRRVTDQLLEKKVLLEARIVPGGDHCEASWERQIPFFMRTLEYAFDSQRV